LISILHLLRRRRFQRRLLKFLDLPLERSPGGDAKATAWSWYLLAGAFEDGTEIPEDTALAFRCYLRSAQAGLPIGQICTGLAYFNGTGTPVDLVAAQAWWQAAADQGDPGGEVLVGIQGGPTIQMNPAMPSSPQS